MTPAKWWSTVATLAASGTAAPYVASRLGIPPELQGMAVAAIASGPAALLHLVMHGPLAQWFLLSRLNARRRDAALIAAYVEAAMEAKKRRDAARSASEEDPVVPSGPDAG